MSSHPWELAWREGRWYEASPAFPGVLEFGKYLKEVGAKTVLDLGSGAGRHAVHLAKEGFRVVAFDISQSALKILNDRLKTGRLDNVLVAQSDMSKLPFKGDLFDAVVGYNVLQHATVRGISRALSEVHRVMRIGAVGYFSVLSQNDYKYGAGQLLEQDTYASREDDEVGIVHHFFSMEELRSHLSQFEIVSLTEELIPIEKGDRGHFHVSIRKSKA